MKTITLQFAQTGLFLFLLVFLSPQIKAQNLVPNPSFEDYNNTFCGLMESNNVFNNLMVDWQLPTEGTADLYFTNVETDCYNYQPESLYAGPIGFKGTESPKTGKVMAGIWVYTIDGLNQREYLQVPLSAPLEIGTMYTISFAVSAGDFMESFIEELGVYFSTTVISASGNDPLDFTPQVTVTTGLDNFTGWTTVTLSFSADQAYTHLVLGNFSSDANTTLIENPNASGGVGTYGAYYFIDDVSVVEDQTNAIQELDEQAIQLSPNPLQEEFTIKSSTGLLITGVKIVTLLGREIFQTTLNTVENYTMPCSFLSAGSYIVIIETTQGSYFKKVIKHDY